MVNAAIQIAYFCVCVKTMYVGLGWVHPVGDSLVTICSSTGGTCMLPWYCGHLAAPLSSLVEAEWIWDSKEVINLHIGDMSAE